MTRKWKEGRVKMSSKQELKRGGKIQKANNIWTHLKKSVNN